jgi:SNF2-related domain
MSSKIPEQYSVGTIPVRPRVGSLLDMSAATLGRTGTPWKGHFSQLSRSGFEYEKCADAIRRGIGFYYIPAPKARRTSRNQIELPPRKTYLTTASLVVVPTNLVRQWESEIRKHTNGLLKVLVLSKSTDELPQAVELAEYDIVLFSRQRFDKESRDGTNVSLRRHSVVAKRCTCRPKMICECFNYEAYHSPLRDLHFKRLITDEGHTMGNSNNSYSSNSVIVVDFLNVSAKWIVSGTPTQGLYGESMLAIGEENDVDEFDTNDTLDIDSEQKRKYPGIDPEQERKDLEKLGNIATYYLKVRPWANTREGHDAAPWSHYVMQPKHGSRSYGNMEWFVHLFINWVICR